MSTDYDLDQNALYDNFINDESLGPDKMYDYVRNALLKLIIQRKQYVAESKERIREERKSKKMSEIRPVGVSKLFSSKASNQNSEDHF